LSEDEFRKTMERIWTKNSLCPTMLSSEAVRIIYAADQMNVRWVLMATAHNILKLFQATEAMA
jgi:hypothetical protein